MHNKSVLVAVCMASIASAIPTKRETGQVVTASVALPSATFDEHAGGAASPNYNTYAGDGSDGWPIQSQWASFANLWEASVTVMQSCDPPNTQQNIEDIHAAIITYAGYSKVDPRYILATIMQESSGCVLVDKTHHHGTPNPGLMQSHNGKGTCEGQDTCGGDMIGQMISDGTMGTTEGDGLAGLINQAQDHYPGDSSARLFYAASRLYYTGSTDPDWTDLNLSLGKNNCYVMDIANRLTGWTDETTRTCVNQDNDY